MRMKKDHEFSNSLDSVKNFSNDVKNNMSFQQLQYT